MEFLTEKTFLEGIKKIESSLMPIKTQGSLTSFDGISIHYEFFKVSNAKATVVAVHGLGEFTKKYYEFTYALTESGYNVMLYDQRCHGLSSRLTDNVRLIHVNDFFDYVKDLELIINKTAEFSNSPIYLYAHSMGGAVGVLYLENHRNIQKTVLTAPMFLPTSHGLPLALTRILLFLCKLFQSSSARFRYTADFNPNHKFKNTPGTSYSRFCHNMNLRKNEILYQANPMTVGWTYHAFKLMRPIMKAAKNIKTSVLLLSPKKDTAVKIKPHYRFCKKCATCTLKSIKNAKHSMLSADDNTVKAHIEQVIDYYNS